MVTQESVSHLQSQLQRLRGDVFSKPRLSLERVDRALREARRMHDQALGTAYEAPVRSVENLLHCLRAGLLTQLDQPTRRAG